MWDCNEDWSVKESCKSVGTCHWRRRCTVLKVTCNWELLTVIKSKIAYTLAFTTRRIYKKRNHAPCLVYVVIYIFLLPVPQEIRRRCLVAYRC